MAGQTMESIFLGTILLVAFILTAEAGFAQGVPHQNIAIGNNAGTAVVLSNQPVYVCTSAGSGSPCLPRATIYSDSALTRPITQPLLTDSNGNFSFWASPGQTYYINIVPAGFSSLAYYWSAPVVCNTNGILTVNSNCYTTLARAFAACPSTGCTIDMRGDSSTAALALGSFDPGDKGPVVTVLLGPFTYTATTITLRAGLHLIGTGGPTSTSAGTEIIAQSTSAPLIQGPPNATDQPALWVLLQDLQLIGPGFTQCTAGRSSSSTDGILLDASASTSAVQGTWYGVFTRVHVCNFGGNQVHMKGAEAVGHNGVNQFNHFIDLVATRALGGGSAMRIEGANIQTYVDGDSELDSNYLNSNIDTSSTPNVYVGCAACAFADAQPYVTKFDGTTIQGAATLVQIDGAWQTEFQQTHHEQGHVAYLLTIPSTTFSDLGVVVRNSSFNGNVGIKRGRGALVNVAATQAAGVIMQDDIYLGGGLTPDNVLEISGGGLPASCCQLINFMRTTSSGEWPVSILNPTGTVLSTSFTTTAATSDNVTVTGMTSSGHCYLTPTNSGAAGGIASVFISAKSTNLITVAHGPTSGWTFDVVCTPW